MKLRDVRKAAANKASGLKENKHVSPSLHRSTWIALVSGTLLGLYVLAPEVPPDFDDNGRLTATVTRIKDGDSFFIGKVEIRIKDIDTPEPDQTCDFQGKKWECGKAATNQLSNLILDKTVYCQFNYMNYDRHVSTCSIEGKDIGRIMMRLGLADVHRGDRKGVFKKLGVYRDEHREVQGRCKGIWATDFVLPYHWRNGPLKIRKSKCKATVTFEALSSL